MAYIVSERHLHRFAGGYFQQPDHVVGERIEANPHLPPFLLAVRRRLPGLARLDMLLHLLLAWLHQTHLNLIRRGLGELQGHANADGRGLRVLDGCHRLVLDHALFRREQPALGALRALDGLVGDLDRVVDADERREELARADDVLYLGVANVVAVEEATDVFAGQQRIAASVLRAGLVVRPRGKGGHRVEHRVNLQRHDTDACLVGLAAGKDGGLAFDEKLGRKTLLHRGRSDGGGGRGTGDLFLLASKTGVVSAEIILL
mmetsp:Transcript_19613/g.39770  ORF Transcript_19613/g.39770 Transcript_19613/m.39770 type:complete len:261 (-) Transcript_19613:242-1024(-)